jgi:hypothetical protein
VTPTFVRPREVLAHTITHFSFVNGGPRTEIFIQKDMCIEAR